MTPERRKTVTVLFADVAGSTALGERLDPEALRAVLADWFDVARVVIERHGGTVEKFVGDAVMSVFGIPHAHDDDALRAVRAASELGERLGELNDDLQRRFGLRIQTRVGVNTGLVVTGTEERLVTGDAVNVAARLEQGAAPGEVLLGDQTWRLVRHAVEAEAFPLTARGKTHEVSAHRLLRLAEGVLKPARRVEAPLVGRRSELNTLVSALEGTIEENVCRLVTVIGPAGIGKSRLAAELRRVVRDRATVLTGRCPAYGEGITYWPLGEMVREAAQYAAVATIFELLAGEDDGKRVAELVEAALGTGGGAVREEIFWAVRRLFERLARDRPLAIILEDTHWAQPTFLELVEYLVGRAQGTVLIVCLARPEIVEERPAWLSLGQPLELEPLSREESGELVEHLAHVGEEARRTIVERAEGNPLFVEQLLAMAVESDFGLDMPPTIQAVLDARFDRLPQAERAFLERASVVGREFWLGAVASLSLEEERPGLAGILLSLERKGFVGPERSDVWGQDWFRFHHVLIRDGAYQGISKTQRSVLHEQVALWLEEHTPDRGRERDEIVGYHLEQAYRFGSEVGPPDERLATEAAERLTRAGRAAYDRGDTPAAVNLLTRAATLLTAASSERLELLPDLAVALMETGDLHAAGDRLDEAMRAGREPSSTRAAVLRSQLEVQTGTAGDVEDVRHGIEAAIPVLERHSELRGLARAWLTLSAVAIWQGRMIALGQAAAQAARHARDAGDRRAEAEALWLYTGSLVYSPAPVAESIADVEARLTEVEPNSMVEAAMIGQLAALKAMAGDASAAQELVARAKALLDRLGLTYRLGRLALYSSRVALLRGDLASAEKELRSGVDILTAAGIAGTSPCSPRASRAFSSDVAISTKPSVCLPGWNRSCLPKPANRSSFSLRQRPASSCSGVTRTHFDWPTPL